MVPVFSFPRLHIKKNFWKEQLGRSLCPIYLFIPLGDSDWIQNKVRKNNYFFFNWSYRLVLLSVLDLLSSLRVSSAFSQVLCCQQLSNELIKSNKETIKELWKDIMFLETQKHLFQCMHIYIHAGSVSMHAYVHSCSICSNACIGTFMQYLFQCMHCICTLMRLLFQYMHMYTQYLSIAFTYAYTHLHIHHCVLSTAL